jgi:hypothetical protein
VSAFLVIERPDHSPRVLGAFGTRQDAVEAREILVKEEPEWETFVSIWTPKPSRGHDQRHATTFIGLWLVALLVVDAVLSYGLYLSIRALLDLV